MIFLLLALLWINGAYMATKGFGFHDEVFYWSLFYVLVAAGILWEMREMRDW